MDRHTILSTIIDQIRIVVPDLATSPIGEQDNMTALGIDSMDRQEILILTLEAINLNLPMVQLHGQRNLGELANLLLLKLGV